MSRAALIFALPLLFACTKKDEAPVADTSAVVAAEPAAPSIAGSWAFNVMPADRDTVLSTYTLVTTNDQNGWTLTFPGREPIPVRVVSMSNDSIVTETGPFESSVYKGVKTNLVHTNLHWEGDRLVGTGIAHYDRKTADSVVNLRQEGTRK